MSAILFFPFCAMIFMTVEAIWSIQDEWRMVRFLQEEYYVERSWVIIIFASLSTIILWVFFLYSMIKWLIL